MDVIERITRCLAKHPDWETKRISSSAGGTMAMIEAIRTGAPIPARAIPPGTPDGITAKDSPAFTSISLTAIRDRLDVAAMIRRQVGSIPKGQLLPEDELCRLTAGRDRNRFRRAVENNPDEFRVHRVRLRLDESTDGKWFWGRSDDIAEAVRIRDL